MMDNSNITLNEILDSFDTIEGSHIVIENLVKEIEQLKKERDEYKKCKQYWYEKYQELKESQS